VTADDSDIISVRDGNSQSSLVSAKKQFLANSTQSPKIRKAQNKKNQKHSQSSAGQELIPAAECADLRRPGFPTQLDFRGQ
jgi:hypothetical protein